VSNTPPEVDRTAASRAAVAARRARAAVKQHIACGERSCIDVLDASADAENTAEHRLRVTEFLSSIPRIGATKTQRILATLRISPAKRLGGLGAKQRIRLREYLEEHVSENDRPRLLVLAGPTAVGKGTVAAYIREHYPEVMISVSATTRTPRPGEVDGVHYRFLGGDEFQRLVDEDEFLEHAVVHNLSSYGTLRAPIQQALDERRPVMLEIDIQGARQVRSRMPDARLVFLRPPSWDELVNRLVGRGTESADEQARRLETAKVELAAQDEFDDVVVNDSVAEAARKVVALMGIAPKEDADG